ncbi:MAG: sugar ABC transporter permease [Clostridiales bacterium]|nr:sugar ABC transporter permease [Clostridiales bacterium]
MKNPFEAHRRELTRKSLGQRVWEYRYLYLMLLPAIAAMLFFHYVPMYGIQIAFKDFKPRQGIWGSDWVGIKYFMRMFREYTFLSVLRNTLLISFLKLAICFPAGVVFALLLNEIGNLRLKKAAQTISYLPHFISWVVLGGIVKTLFSLNGPVNALVALFGGEKTMYLTKSGYFIPILILTEIWKTMGWGSIVYLAAIAGVPAELYESAQMDGASRLQRMRYITFPSILPVVVTLFILRVGNIMNAGFDQIFNLYSPIVYDVADIIDTYSYRVGLLDNDFSYSTAIGLFKNVIGVALMLSVNQLSRRINRSGV